MICNLWRYTVHSDHGAADSKTDSHCCKRYQKLKNQEIFRVFFCPFQISSAHFMSQNHSRRCAEPLEQNNHNILNRSRNRNCRYGIVSHSSISKGVHGSSQAPHKFIGNHRPCCHGKLPQKRTAVAPQLLYPACKRGTADKGYCKKSPALGNSGNQRSKGRAGSSHGRRSKMTENKNIVK